MRTALYLRISRDLTGEGAGVKRQRQDGLRLIKIRKWTLVATYCENDTSAAGKVKRPEFDKLMASIERGEVDAVVIWKIDRISRNPHDRLRILEAGRKHGLIISQVQGGDVNLATPDGRLMAGFLADQAQYEIEVKGERQTRANAQRAEDGKPPSGVRLTGYKKNKRGETVLKKREAAIVATLFSRFAAGDSLRSLAQWLNDSEVPTRHGGRWHTSSVHGILRNPRYAGKQIYQGEVVEGIKAEWEPVVSEEVFNVVQDILDDPRRKTQNGTDRKHLGSGLFECGVCGHILYAWSGNRYHCPNGHLTRKQTKIDELVIETIYARLSAPDLAGLLPKEDTNIRELTDEIDMLRARIRTFQNEFYEEHITGLELKIGKQRAQAQIDQLRAKLAGAYGRKSEILAADNPAEAFREAPLMIKRATISILCTVKLYPAPRGSRTFDPDTVNVEWKTGEPQPPALHVVRPAETA